MTGLPCPLGFAAPALERFDAFRECVDVVRPMRSRGVASSIAFVASLTGPVVAVVSDGGFAGMRFLLLPWSWGALGGARDVV